MSNNGNNELEAALKKIKIAYLAGVIIVVGQILIQIALYISFASSGLTNQNRLSTPSLILLIVESAIVLALCYGVYKKSKPCAIALLIYSALTTLLILVSGRLPLVGIILAFAAFQGIQGISAYRRLINH
ncbi:MAG: hypothetical protein HC769_33190 [Cyanobacteria bacterium CRU_2_1]|nr:hypothetical protein [Cyanobacteria bacterium CRU_2_1]